jgi:hypothetical protein
LENWVSQLTITHVYAGHWWPETHARDLAALLLLDPDGSREA